MVREGGATGVELKDDITVSNMSAAHQFCQPEQNAQELGTPASNVPDFHADSGTNGTKSSEYLLALAERELERRKVRISYLTKEFFSDAAWAMLLDLFVKEQRGREPSEAELCEASLIAPKIALRWLDAMEQAGLLSRSAAPTHPSVDYVYLTKTGRNAVTAILSS